MTWPDLLSVLVARRDLTREQTAWAMDQVMQGSVSPVVVGAFLVALRTKGQTVDELTGLADAMVSHAVPLPTVPGGPSRAPVDIVGTGGDRAHTVNISTMASIVIAGAGIPVIKHGNRAASSSSGSADVLEALGIRLDHAPQDVARIYSEAGITFCFAQTFHPSMRHAAVARRELGIATAFNFLGPLTNPAAPRATAVGCADLAMAPLMAGVFASRGTSALVFRGADGLDELAGTGPALVWEVKDGAVTRHELDLASELDLARITVADLRGASAEHNADVARRLLDGEPGPVRETVQLNAAAALVADATLPGTDEGSLVDRLRAGYGHAAQSIGSGAAAQVLRRWAEASAR